MNKIIVLCGLVLLLSGCHNYSSNVGETLGCVLAGNGCDDGRTGATGATGLTGAAGLNGTNGIDGINGSSCSVSSVIASPLVAPNGGARITCTDGTDALVLNGSPGSDAPPTPYSVVQVVKPCPTIGGSFPEVLLVMQDRSILASVSDNGNAQRTRLALIPQGSYTTTDNRNCNFTVGATTISWAGGSVTY